MKRREFLKLSGTIAGAAMTIHLPAGWTPAKAAAKSSTISCSRGLSAAVVTGYRRG